MWLAEHARESGVVLCLGAEINGRTRGVDGSFLGQSSDRTLVRPAEACEARPSGAVELATGKPAMVINVATVTVVDSREAIVEVEHYRTAVLSGRRKYRVVREVSRWVCLGEIVDMSPS